MGARSAIEPGPSERFWALGLGIAGVIGLYLASLHSYLLFHTLAEIFTVVVAFSIFVIAWNSRHYSSNGYLLFVGIAYLALGILDLLHTLGYAGMPVFPGYPFVANQLWIAARFLESLSLLAGFAYLSNDRSPDPRLALFGFLLVTGLIIASIFFWHIFPVCFVAGQGQTRFKILSEYAIIGILAVDVSLLIRNRLRFQRNIYLALLVATLLAIFTEAAFTVYVSNYGPSNMVGHYLKVFSYTCIYVAIVKNGVERPYELIFRELTEVNARLAAEAAAHRAVAREREQVQTALRETNDLLRLFIRNSPIYAYIKEVTPTESRILQASDNFEQLFQMKGAEVVGKTVAELFPSDLAEQTLHDDLVVVSSGQALELEEELNGRTYTTLKFPIVQGGRTLLAGFTIDITERKQAEAELQSSRNQFRELSARLNTVLESPVGVVVFALDANYCYTTYTKAHKAVMKTIWGTDISLGMNLLEVISNPKDREKAKANFDRALAGEHLVLIEEYGASPSRSSYENRYSPITNEEGRVCGLTVFVIDISEQKEAEKARLDSQQMLSTAFAMSPDAFAITRLEDGVYLEINQGFSKILGFTRSEIIGRSSASELDSLWADPKDRERLIAILNEKGEVIDFEAAFYGKNRRAFMGWMSAKIFELNGVRHILSYTRDITERKRAEEEKLRLQIQLLQSQKLESLGMLAGGVAHDMNNVLGAILGLASAHLGKQPYGSPLHQALDTICKATERGGKMVKGLLSFARQSPAEERQLDLNAILRDQVSLLERTTLAMVRLHLDLEASLHPILGDASALTNAFMNLCVNAVDAMPENGTLTLRTRNVDSDWIEVVVEDTGTGMSQEVLEKAMDPFYTTKDVGKGTGLGLSMVFTTVKAHGGQMALQSELGQGTRVILRFPACEDDGGIHIAEPGDSGAMVATPRTVRVLLVDDDDLIQTSVQATLEVLGHTAVSTAQSGEEALAMLEAGFEADLIILDMNMPGLGGIGTLPRLRVLRPAVPVLLCTGRADQTALALAAAYPGVTLLPKPFGLKELQKHLKDIGLG